MALATAPSTALTVVERVEQSPAVQLLDARAQALVDLLPDAAAATRFRRVVVQALAKNPELLECTPESVVLSVFEAATQGLEPTGAAGGAHLVPYNVKVGNHYEKRAQLIPDYRGVVRLITKEPTQVVSLEARVVKEGDEFGYTEGTDAFITHTPSLAPGRSEKATTHVYAIARLKNGGTKAEVMDRAAVERIQKRGRGSSFSPWASDWDEMAKKTVVKRTAKLLPVSPEVRSILVRDDELAGEADPSDAPATPTGPTKVSRLAQRLVGAPAPAPEPAAAAEPAADEVEGEVTWLDAPADFPSRIRAIAASVEDPEVLATPEQLDALKAIFAGSKGSLVAAGVHALFDDESGPQDPSRLSAGQAGAIAAVHDELGHDAFELAWRGLTEQAPA
jgi:recombination protein RecT